MAFPPFWTIVLQTRLNPRTHFLATALAFCVRMIDRTRACSCALFTGARLARRSARSNALSFRRSQLQYFSAGFKSGDLAGIDRSLIPSHVYAARLGGALMRAHAFFTHPDLPTPVTKVSCHFVNTYLFSRFMLLGKHKFSPAKLTY